MVDGPWDAGQLGSDIREAVQVDSQKEKEEEE